MFSRARQCCGSALIRAFWIARLFPVHAPFDRTSAPWRIRSECNVPLVGIAWDPQNRRLFVTGKYWPKLYEVTVREFGEREAAAVADRVAKQCLVA
mmetsp:Transcript_14351/g.33986  ORF Transcript_14351/g.33986 Transcript_14351/m.33986 type:complete len:96 (+) Transcript_14351:961-1248(+)